MVPQVRVPNSWCPRFAALFWSLTWDSPISGCMVPQVRVLFWSLTWDPPYARFDCIREPSGSHLTLTHIQFRIDQLHLHHQRL